MWNIISTDDYMDTITLALKSACHIYNSGDKCDLKQGCIHSQVKYVYDNLVFEKLVVIGQTLWILTRSW